MSEEIIEEVEKPKPPRIGDFGTRLDAQGNLEVYWYVENADTVEIQDFVNPTFDLDDSQRILITQRTVLTLIAKNSSQATQMSITVPPPTKEEESKIPKKRNGVSVHVLPDKSSHGFLVEGGALRLPEGAPKQVKSEYCPVCEKKADPWEPPVGDQKYDRVFQMYKQRLGSNVTDQQVHAAFLKQTGGYIALCTGCQTSFFVPSI